MSRWEKRTQEEKERIYRVQVLHERPEDVERKTTLPTSGSDILAAGGIPIYCRRCGDTVESKKYTVYRGQERMTGQPTDFIRGQCLKCGQDVTRPLTAGAGAVEAQVIALNFIKLMKAGRLDDVRKFRKPRA